MHLAYTATWGGLELTVIVRLKLLPESKEQHTLIGHSIRTNKKMYQTGNRLSSKLLWANRRLTSQLLLKPDIASLKDEERGYSNDGSK